MTQTEEKALEKLKRAQAHDDPELAHVLADDVLCELLSNLGYSDVVKEFKKVERWYA